MSLPLLEEPDESGQWEFVADPPPRFGSHRVALFLLAIAMVICAASVTVGAVLLGQVSEGAASDPPAKLLDVWH